MRNGTTSAVKAAGVFQGKKRTIQRTNERIAVSQPNGDGPGQNYKVEKDIALRTHIIPITTTT